MNRTGAYFTPSISSQNTHRADSGTEGYQGCKSVKRYLRHQISVPPSAENPSHQVTSSTNISPQTILMLRSSLSRHSYDYSLRENLLVGEVFAAQQKLLLLIIVNSILLLILIYTVLFKQPVTDLTRANHGNRNLTHQSPSYFWCPVRPCHLPQRQMRRSRGLEYGHRSGTPIRQTLNSS